MRGSTPVPTDSVRQPRIAEMVADILREQLLSGVIADGDELPSQDDLLQRFGVSKPSLREAMRILEAQGLVTIRRGSRGGGIVHLPKVENVASTLGLVLRSRQIPIDDVSVALVELEALCAMLCAQRADRRETVLPALRARLKQEMDSQANPAQAAASAERLQEEVVQRCGNETLTLVAGALRALCADGAGAEPTPLDAPTRLAAHREIVNHIEAGRGVEAMESMRRLVM